jgi:hypothetical protein
MAMQQVIVDISQRNVSFDSTSLVSMVLSSNEVSSSSRGSCMAKVTAHAGKDQRSMSDDPVLKPTCICVSNDLLTREQLISAQKEELVQLPCSKSFSVEEAENVNSLYIHLAQSHLAVAILLSILSLS